MTRKTSKMRVRRAVLVILFLSCLEVSETVLTAFADDTAASAETLSNRAASDEFSVTRLRDDWPCWRGPLGNNHSLDASAPVAWSADTNVLWKTALPGRGHAGPCIVDNQIYLPAADDKQKTQFLLCLNRANGEILWRKDLRSGGLPPINKFNSHASATAACDGAAVYVALAGDDQLWVFAVSQASGLLWQKNVGGYQHANGFGASPILHRNLVIVASDNQLDPAMIALNRSNGSMVWKTARRKSDNSATPVLGTVAGRKQLLINGAYTVTSYDPDTGEEIWNVSHGTEVAACTMAFDEENVYASGNVPEKNLLAVRGNGRGDVTETHVLWSTSREIPYVPSPIRVGGYLFVVSDAGTAYCRDAASGEVIWKERLGGNFFASPVFAAGNLYATNDAGRTYVFRANAKFKLIAENNIAETCMATPVVCGGRVYLRTADHLYCIGSEKSGGETTLQ